MTQETVEQILGRLLTDGRFRERFFAQTREQLRQFELLQHERESLSKLEQVRVLVEILSEKLDPRIVRG